MKKNTNSLDSVDALILCGGLGTRLRPVVSDRQKVMAEVGSRPFLEIVVQKLLKHGFKRIIFCVGYLGNHIENHFKKNNFPNDVIFEFSREEKPLGTGGAIKNALPLVKSDVFLVSNGDSFFDIDLENFYLNHKKGDKAVSIALLKTTKNKEGGNVRLGDFGEILSFTEKEGETSLMNGGFYLMEKTVQEHFPDEENFSLEYDLFPKLIEKSGGFVFEGTFIDMGTPDRYEIAKKLFDS